MNKITQSTIETLTQQQTGQVLTMYIPTHRIATAATIKEDKIRYKNLIGVGTAQWQESLGDQSITDVKQQLERKLEDESFWAESAETLAVFADQEQVQIFHLPIECEEYIHVGDAYDISPLRIFLGINQPFYMFVLAMHQPKLLQGDRYGLTPVEIDFPVSPEDALNIDEMFANSSTGRGNASHGVSPHGQGDTNHAGQEERLMYFRMLDDMILNAEVVDAKRPIILAATESEASDYKSLSRLPQLIQTHIGGNHTQTPLNELHALAWQLLKNEVYSVQVTAATDRFNESKGVDKASSDIAEIAKAAAAGRIDCLLVGMVYQTNDSVDDAATGSTSLIRFSDGYRENHICRIIEDVARQGGRIMGVEYDQLATPSGLAGIYRY